MKFWILLTALIAVNVFGEVTGEVTGIQVPEVTVEPVTVTVENPVTVCTPVGTTVPVVDLPEVSNPADRIGKVQNFLKMALVKFRDQRNWKSDRTFGIDSESVEKWLKIYDGSDPASRSYAVASGSDRLKGLRMIAEVHHPIDQNALRKNLAMYQQKGYNAVLLTFGYQGETLAEVIAAADLIRGTGLKVWFAYSGPEKLEHSVFMDPDVLKKYLQELSIRADGFLIGWRRTSVHLLVQDEPFRDYLIKCVRDVNPSLSVLGEAYYGMTAHTNHYMRVTYNLPEHASGCYVMGFGFGGYDPGYYLSRLNRIKDMPKVAVIVGEKPYYGSTNATGRSFEENLRIKQEIENRWLAAGCVGTITLHGDCSDGIYNEKISDNIGKE